MRIPMLAIHLNRDILTKGFELNKQTHLVPVLASAVQKAANQPMAPSSNGSHAEADGLNKRQKVDGAGDAADLTPKPAKVSSLCSSALVFPAHYDLHNSADELGSLRLFGTMSRTRARLYRL